MKRFGAQMEILLGAAVVFFAYQNGVQARTNAVEQGLEQAVQWKWSVAAPQNQDWGLSPRRIPVAEKSVKPIAASDLHAADDANAYIVKKGDVLIRIAKRFGLTVAQLKEFNQLANETIHIGQILRIPTQEERRSLRSTPAPSAAPSTASPSSVSEVLVLRVFLDNQQFSAGPISDTPDPIFARVLYTYQTGHGGNLSHADVVERARATNPAPLTDYILRAEDFRFILPPKALAAGSGKASAPLASSYKDMVAADMLAYRSPWEFVAEKFKCDEKFLKKLNPGLMDYPFAGTKFRVPNVVPFEIENVPFSGLQPPADSSKPINAVVRDMTLLEIYRAGDLIAVMPLSSARPKLRGRGEWRILAAIPLPRMATIQEPRVVQVDRTGPFYVNPDPTPVVARPVLATEQYLPSGPNNPAGVVWINLAKGDDGDPLPFGLHGTSSPSSMFSTESIGGFRLANWDIVRAARLLPEGTKLEWKP